MQIYSVNIGQSQPIQRAKSSGKTGIFKLPTAGKVQVTKLGLAGDAVVDRKNHGGVDQAVYLYTTDDYDWWSEQLETRLAPGTFGENLTITGLQSAACSVGDILRLNDVVLQVTSPRIPCVTLAARMNDPQFPKHFRSGERPGLYCRVLQEGMVQAGDPVTLEPYLDPTVTILEMFRDYYEPRHAEADIRRYLNAPIAIRARIEKEAELQKVRQEGRRD